MYTQYYYEGVYSSSRCSSTDVNHGMVVTGYGATGGYDFWLVKNRYKDLPVCTYGVYASISP